MPHELAAPVGKCDGENRSIRVKVTFRAIIPVDTDALGTFRNVFQGVDW